MIIISSDVVAMKAVYSYTAIIAVHGVTKIWINICIYQRHTKEK